MDGTVEYVKTLNDSMYYGRERYYIYLDGRMVEIDCFESLSEFSIQITTRHWYVVLPVNAPWSVRSSDIVFFDEDMRELNEVFKRAS